MQWGKAMLAIQNAGADIASSNYWDTELARVGVCYLSFNAGAARLLLPPDLTHQLKCMARATHAVISRGPNSRGRDRLEILFEGTSTSAFSIELTTKVQADQPLTVCDAGKPMRLSVWIREGKQLELPCDFRVVSLIPCLQPWTKDRR